MKKKINRPNTVHSTLKLALSGTAIAALFVVSLVTLPATEKGKAVAKAEAEKMAAQQKSLAGQPTELVARASDSAALNPRDVRQVVAASVGRRAPMANRPGASIRRPKPTPLSGIKNVPGDYPDLSSAITDLNAQGVGAGGVTLNVLAGNPQTADAGGYVVGGPGSLVLTTTGPGSPVIIEGNGNTVTASATQVVGSLTDAIFKLVGADYITIQDFFMQEDPANTNTTPATNNMTEWGVALLRVDQTDGAQNNIILNNTISLNRAYSNTYGVYSNTRHSAIDPLTAEEPTNSTTAPNHGNEVYANAISNANVPVVFSGSSTAANMDVGNDVGGAAPATGNALTNWGSSVAPVSAFIGVTGNIGQSGIFMNEQKSFNVSNNSLTSAALTGTLTLNVRGVHTNYNPTSPTGTFTINLNSNTVTLNADGTGQIHGVAQFNTGAVANANITLNMNGNTMLNSGYTGPTSAVMFCILNASAWGTVNMNNNVIKANTSSGTAAGLICVTSQAAVVNNINLNNNMIGAGATPAITFTSATSGTVAGVYNTAGATTAALSAQGNDLRGINYNVASTGTFYGIYNAVTVGSENVSGNTFTNLNLNITSGTAYLMYMSNSTAGAITVANNSIVTGFVKGTAASNTGAFYCLYNFGSPAAGTHNINNNTFSNITTNSTSASLYGIYWRTLSGPTANINNNTVSNWSNSGNTGSIICLYTSYNTNLNTFSNTVNSITSGGSVTGINFSNSSTTNGNCYSNAISGLSTSGASATVQGINVGDSSGGTTLNIYQNTINTLSGSGATSPLARGINVTAGTTVKVFKNKICDLSETGAISTTAGAVTGLLMAAGTTVTAYDNLIGDLRAPAANLADAIRGIAVTSTTASTTYNAYFNSVYISATSSGANFGTSGVFHTGSATATTAKLDLRDNIIDNVSTPNGTGLTVEHRRSGAGLLANYASTSNNNLFYAGTPDASHLIFYDGTNSDQTLAAYQARVAPADSASISSDPGFISTTCGSLDTPLTTFLHITNASPAYHTGAAVTGVMDDYDGDLRNPSTPDIGADEVFNFTGTLVTITKTADSGSVNYGNPIGFTVRLTNTTPNAATNLMVTDNLPAGPGVNWSIDGANTDPGWSVSGSPPNQSLVYSPTSLPGNTMTRAHVVSNTDVSTCGSTLSNTASFTSDNGGNGMASASVMITGIGGLTTILTQGFESGFGSWIVTNNTINTACPAAVAWAIQTNPYDPSSAGCGGSTGQTPINSMSGANFCMANSDAGGSGVNADTTLTSPSFSTVGYTSLNLAFRHFYRNLLSTETAAVDISTDGGGTWTNLANYGPLGTQGTATNFAAVSIDLSAYIGNGNVQVRFHYVAGWDWYWAVDDIVVTGNAPPQPCPTPAMITSAVSRKLHAGVPHDINLALTGTNTVECRTDTGLMGQTSDYTIVVTFAGNVTVTGSPQAQMTMGTGCVGTAGVCDGNVTVSGNVVTVPLTLVDNEQNINVRINGVNGAANAPATDFDIPMGVLWGDSNQNRTVNAADIALIKQQSGQPVTGANFREDVNRNGAINAADISIAKRWTGHGIP